MLIPPFRPRHLAPPLSRPDARGATALDGAPSPRSPRHLEERLRELYRQRELAGCKLGEDPLPAFASDQLTPRERARFEDHCQGCADCQRILRLFAEVRGEWEAAQRDAPP